MPDSKTSQAVVDSIRLSCAEQRLVALWATVQFTEMFRALGAKNPLHDAELAVRNVVTEKINAASKANTDLLINDLDLGFTKILSGLHDQLRAQTVRRARRKRALIKGAALVTICGALALAFRR
jgi:hypothetical protein